MSSNKGLVKLWYIHAMEYSRTVIYKTNDTERYPFMVYYCRVQSHFYKKKCVCLCAYAFTYVSRFLEKIGWKDVSGRNLWVVELWMILNL